MNLDDAFPIGAVSPRTRAAILHEFQGRCPSVREIAKISDKQWLATPGIGSTALEAIRSVTDDQPSTVEASPSTGMTDVELLHRFEFIQEELRCIHSALKARREHTLSSGARVQRQTGTTAHKTTVSAPRSR
jgi:hypothetical protein